jgi:hypothetical protein
LIVEDDEQKSNKKIGKPSNCGKCADRYRGPLVEVRQFGTNGDSGSRSGR